VTTVISEGICCADCALAMASNEYSGMDDATAARVRAAMASFARENLYPALGDEYGFSWRGCDCCGSDLGGDKFEFVVLADDKREVAK
jgi:hypothetical protein